MNKDKHYCEYRLRVKVTHNPTLQRLLHVEEATVSRDISSLRQQAQLNLKTHINHKLPEEYQNCMTGINQVLKICWEIVNKSRNMSNDNGKL